MGSPHNQVFCEDRDEFGCGFTADILYAAAVKNLTAVAVFCTAANNYWHAENVAGYADFNQQ